MEHLLIAYDILVIIIGFAALSNTIVWALRTGYNDLGNFSIVYALFTLMMVILVLGKYLFLNVAAYPGRTWYYIWGVYEVFDFGVVVAALYYFLDAHQFRFGRRAAAGLALLTLICYGLFFSPYGATLDESENIIRLGTGFWIAVTYWIVLFTCAIVLGFWLLVRVWKTEKRTFNIGFLIFASVGYTESLFSFIRHFGAMTRNLQPDRGFLYSSIPYALYGLFLIVYFLRYPTSAPLASDEISAEFLSKYRITERERELILKVMQGKSNADIGRELFISLPTVKTHLHNIYQKLGVDSRYDLLAKVRSGQ
ncbi:MAG TPA: helix-turn-helix transcriptional regulator [Anaerolineales bacterium]